VSENASELLLVAITPLLHNAAKGRFSRAQKSPDQPGTPGTPAESLEFLEWSSPDTARNTSGLRRGFWSDLAFNRGSPALGRGERAHGDARRWPASPDATLTKPTPMRRLPAKSLPKDRARRAARRQLSSRRDPLGDPTCGAPGVLRSAM